MMYLQSNTLLLAVVFKNFRNMCLKICKIEKITNGRKRIRGYLSIYQT